MNSSPPKHPLDLSKLEDRKLKEIEHSRVRREILQGSERRSDTHSGEAAANLDLMIRDKEAFQEHFSNVKYYSVARASEDYEYAWLRRHCRPGLRVLDFACGNGENGLYAAQCGGDVIGIDISPEGVANANANAAQAGVADHCRYEVMDGENLAFEDNTFDIGVEYGALHHVDLGLAMHELARVLNPSGKMICVEALRHNPLIHAYRKRTPQLRTEWEVQHILGVESLDTVRRYFKRVEVKFFHLAVLAAVPFRKTFLFPILRRFLDGVDGILLRPEVIGKYGWIMVFVMSEPDKAVLQTRPGQAE
jgi:ubiquinone/menaquinone biosynthesis C-methylase UbiE